MLSGDGWTKFETSIIWLDDDYIMWPVVMALVEMWVVLEMPSSLAMRDKPRHCRNKDSRPVHFIKRDM